MKHSVKFYIIQKNNKLSSNKSIFKKNFYDNLPNLASKFANEFEKIRMGTWK